MNDQLETSSSGLEFISRWEGCVLKPYKDIVGLRTIGVGHLIKPGENFPDGIEITKEKALEILAKDVKICEDAIKKNIKVPLTQSQFDALVSFGFNCGVGVYASSSACAALNLGKYEEVPAKLLDWSKVKINGVLQVNKGLYNRRKSEGELFSGKNSSLIIWDKNSLIEAQKYLNKLGLYTVKIDGLWGPATAKAIDDFEAKSGVSAGNDKKTKVTQDFFEALKTAAC